MRVSVLLLLLCACAARPRSYTVKLHEEYGHLGNGMRVVLLPDAAAPLVEVDVRYAVGSTQDPPGKAGLAHLVEHMMYLGRLGGPEQPSFSAMMRAHSIFHNAFTTFDSTHYQAMGRRAELATLLGLEAARLASGCETIGEEAFSREREVVRNEIRLRGSSPEAQLVGALHGDVYGGEHPYGRPIGGDDAQVSKLTRDDVCRFMRDHYVPERATLIVAGDIDVPETQSLVAATLGRVPARAAAPLRPVPPVALGKRRVVRETDADETSVIVAFPLPPTFSNEGFAIPFISSILVSRTSQMSIGYDFAAEIRPIVLGGDLAPVLAVQVTVRADGDVDEAREAILRAAGRAHWGLQDADETFLRHAIATDAAFQMESLPGRARAYGDMAQFEPGTGGLGARLGRLSRLRAEQIKRAVRGALDADDAMTIVLRGTKRGGDEHPATRLETAPETRRDELPVDGPQAALAVPVPERPTIVGRARRFELGNGMRVVLLRSSATMPVITARLVFGVGAAHDPPGKRGLAAAVAEVYSGPGEKGVVAIDGAAGLDTTTFTARGIATYPGEIIADLHREVTRPFLPRGYFDWRKQRSERMLARPQVWAAVAVDRATREAVFGGDHPYTTAGLGERSRVDGIATAQGEDFVSRHYNARNATLIVTGSFDEAQMETIVRHVFGGFRSGKPTPPIAGAEAPASGRSVVAVYGPARTLLEVRLAFRTAAGLDDGYAARLVLAEMLGRRAAAVRERLGAAYALDAAYLPAVGPGSLQVTGTVDAARGAESLAALRANIEELRRGEDFLDDFVRARDAVLARELAEASNSAALGARLAQMATFGKDPSYADDLVRAIGRLDPRDVLALARSELDPAHEVIVLGGSRPDVDKALSGAGLAPTKAIDALPR